MSIATAGDRATNAMTNGSRFYNVTFPNASTRLVYEAVLAQPVLTSAEVEHRVGGADVARSLRRDRKMLGLWNGREYLHPAWQFGDGGLDPRVADLLAVLPEDRTGWEPALVLWFPNELLEDHRPMEVWRVDPQRVINALKLEFDR